MKGKRRNRKAPKTFGKTQVMADQTTAHMHTAKTMVPRDGLAAGIGYLQSCGWHAETAERYLRPDPRERF